MPRQGSRAEMIRSRFVRKSAKPGAKRRPKTILMLGAKSIGKTCLAKRFTEGSFIENHKPTVEERYVHDTNYNDYQLHVEIVDIDAFEFPAMRDLSIKEACIVMLLYEVRNRKSFEIMQKIYEIVTEAREIPVPIMIVATKADKLDGEEMMGEQKDPYVDDFVLDINASSHTHGVKHIKTSAKLGYNVTEAFHMGLDDIIKLMTAGSLVSSSNIDKDENDGCCCSMM